MAFTNVQTKLSKALVTNTAGDYALRTVMDGEQDLNGEYLLNDQTTTNMMSKGTVYRFDGVDDFIAMDALAVHLANTNNTVGGVFYKGSIDTFAGTALMLWSFGDTNANEYIYLAANAGGLRGVCAVAGTVQWNFDSDSSFSADTEYDIRLYHNGTIPLLYVNGILQELTFSVSTAKASWFAATTGLDNGRVGCLSKNSAGNTNFLAQSVSEFGYINISNTASEVKDLISGNIPFKWNYGSQTPITITNNGFEADTASPPNGFSVLGSGNVGTAVADGTAPEGSNTCEVVCDGTGNTSNNFRTATATVEVGKQYQVTFYGKAISGDATFQGWISGNTIDDIELTASWVQYTVEFSPTSTTMDFRMWTEDAGTFRIDDFVLTALGAVALYTQDSITANNWFDLAQGNTGAVTGCSVLNPKGISTDEDNIPNFSITSGITADTGSAQGNGVLTASINQISVCGNAGDAVTLPAAKPGKVLWVFNDGANASDVFPASGDNIDEAGANAALSVAVNAEVQFVCTSAGHWSTITSA